MPEKIRELKPPRGLSKLFFRLPILLYRLGLGWLFDNRLLLLKHIGRKIGQQRQAVLEVARHNKVTGTFVVNAGFGKHSDWYQNLVKNPDVSIMVGRRKLNVHAKFLTPEEGGEIMAAFAKEHPLEARMAGVLGYHVNGTEEDFRALGKELLFVKLDPK